LLYWLLVDGPSARPLTGLAAGLFGDRAGTITRQALRAVARRDAPFAGALALRLLAAAAAGRVLWVVLRVLTCRPRCGDVSPDVALCARRAPAVAEPAAEPVVAPVVAPSVDAAPAAVPASSPAPAAASATPEAEARARKRGNASKPVGRE
jgi:hypothetical protein